MSDKTEQPTPRRLRRARQEGDSPVSSALVQAGAFVVVLALVPSVLAAATPVVRKLIERALTQSEPASFAARDLVAVVLGLSLPIVAAGALAAATLGAVQTGGVFSFGKLAPDLARANPIQGVRNLFRMDRLVALLRALGTTLLVAWLAVRSMLSEAASLGNAVGELERGAHASLALAHNLAWAAAFVGLVLSAVDLVTVRHLWLRRLRMTKDEVKREHRQAEGDPELKAARQRAHREALAGSMLNAIRDATVVIVNPTHLATALRYDESEDAAPKVVSQGAGELALKIIQAAHAYGVPVVRDVPVARALAELELGDEIPEALYEAVAEVLHEILGTPAAER